MDTTYASAFVSLFVVIFMTVALKIRATGFGVILTGVQVIRGALNPKPKTQGLGPPPPWVGGA